MGVICASGEALRGAEPAARTTAPPGEAGREEPSTLGNNKQQTESFKATQNKQTGSPDSPAGKVALIRKQGKFSRAADAFANVF